MKKLRFVVVVMLALAASGARADVTPNSLFSDNCVLQQGMTVPVWGTADGEKVTVKILKQKVSTVAKDGKWMVRLKPLKAGGPCSMTISGKNTVELKNVMIGDVWVCSGQSNMAFELERAENGKEDAASSKDDKLRFLTVEHAVSPVPLGQVTGQWVQANPETSITFSAVGYYFGQTLRKTMRWPIGLINSSVGGTPAQAWTNRSALQANPDLNYLLTDPAFNAVPAKAPGVLYNGMIAPLQPYAIKGAIWYQGEANASANDSYRYRILFPAMIHSWREAWRQGDFPFLFVQLAPYKQIRPEPGPSELAELRDSQLYTARAVPKTAMAVITDVGEEGNIHPTKKEPVGSRLARAAMALAYGRKALIYQGPVYRSMKISGDKATLDFDYVGHGLSCHGEKLTGFTIAGADQTFHNADAQIVEKNVVVSSPQVPQPVAVRFGWADYPVTNLFNMEGLPATPFRTDDFILTTDPRSGAKATPRMPKTPKERKKKGQ